MFLKYETVIRLFVSHDNSLLYNNLLSNLSLRHYDLYFAFKIFILDVCLTFSELIYVAIRRRISKILGRKLKRNALTQLNEINDVKNEPNERCKLE